MSDTTGKWNTLETSPRDAYGIGLSEPLVFRTTQQTEGFIHLRLGYYNISDAVFYEAGASRPWNCSEVTHWVLLPPPPSSGEAP